MLEISQAPEDRCSIQLQPQEGEALRSLIIQHTDKAFTRYVEQVGLQPTNVANYLSGRNRMTMATLQKLLAGTNLELQCQLQIQITSGNVVEGVDCTPLEEMLYSQEPDIVVEETTSTLPLFPYDTLMSYLSEKLQEAKKITLDSPSKEQAEESSTLPGPSSPVPLATRSATSLDAVQQQQTLEGTQSTENPPSQK